MPTFTFTSPEGQSYDVSGPGGATKEQAYSILQDGLKSGSIKPKSAPASKQQSAVSGIGDDIKSLTKATPGAIVEPPLHQATSMLGGIAGLGAGALGAILPGPSGQGAKWMGDVSNALTYQPRTTGGQAVSRVADYPLEKLAQGGEYLGHKTADVTGSPLAGALVDATTRTVPMALMGKLGAPAAAEAATAARGSLGKALNTTMDLPSAIARKHQELPASIPRERVQHAIELEDRGVPVSSQQIIKGQQAAPPSASRANKQIEEVHQAYRKSIGLPPGKSLGTGDLQANFKKMNGEYETLLKDRTVQFEPDMFEKMKDMRDHLKSLQDTAGRSAVSSKLMERLNNLTSGYEKAEKVGLTNIRPKMAGTEYNEIRSLLGKDARRTSDDQAASMLYRMQTEFDKAAERSMPDIADDLRGLRTRWRNTSVLDEAAQGSEAGMIPPQKVRSLMERRYGTKAHTMNDDLARIAEAARSLNIKHPGASDSMSLPRVPALSLQGLSSLASSPLDSLRARLYKSGERKRQASEASQSPTVLDPKAQELLRLR